jgi:hypothetical protein
VTEFPRPTAGSGFRVEWLGPKGPHAVENLDSQAYHAICIEIREP